MVATLVLDTCFFDDTFKNQVSSINDFDEQCNGLLIHSENFQALQLLQERYRSQMKCIYIDPPYNAKTSEILYKNSYKHSSWLSLIQNRIERSKPVLTNPFVYIIAIDEVENMALGQMISSTFPECDDSTISIVHNPTGQQGDNFSFTHDFAHFVFPKGQKCIGLEHRNDSSRESEPDIRPLRNVSSGKDHLRTSAANCFYPILIKDGKIIEFGEVCDEDYHPNNINIKREEGTIEVYPIDPSGIESKWVFARNTVEDILDELTVEFDKRKKVWDIIRKKSEFRYKSLWSDKRYSANSWGSVILNNILPNNPFKYPKSIFTVRDCLDAGLNNQTSGIVMDYFAGSGTTGHAIIKLNREDSGKRKYILVEIGDYFDTVLKPRIEKVVYCDSWKNGHPSNRNEGVLHIFKYHRLETYEDALNNLQFNDNETRSNAIKSSPSLKEDFMLHYLLDVETQGSQSLLNIDEFNDPTSYTLKVKKLGSDEYIVKNVDLIETFNYLIGLRLSQIGIPQEYNAEFKRNPDPELPQDQHTKLVVDGEIQQVDDGPWWFRFVKGWVPKDPLDPNNGQKENVLIIWRKLTGDLEKDNLMLDNWFQKTFEDIHELEFDTIYVNGSSNLQNLANLEDTWKVRLLEEEFMKRMWDIENV